MRDDNGDDFKWTDVIRFHGRVSRSTFRTFSLLFLGIAICLIFLPGFVSLILSGLYRRAGLLDDFFSEKELMRLVVPAIFKPIRIILRLSYLLLAIKRIRDAARPLWHLFIPFYNLKILYFEPSKDR